MWLLLLVLIAGWFLTVDASVSIAFRLGELDERKITERQKIEFTVRFVRGLMGLILVLVAFILVS